MAKESLSKVSEHSVENSNKISHQYIENFIHALKNNQTEEAMVLLDSFPALARISSSFFPLPLILAGMHHNIFMMNHLLDLGACPKLARKQPEFKRLPEKSRKYIEMICNFKKRVMERIEALH